MSAYKTLLASDIIVTPVTYTKSFTFTGHAALTASDVGIDIHYGVNTPGNAEPNINLNYSASNYSVYNSIKQLYYTNFLITSSGDPAVVTQNINGVLLNLRSGVTASTLSQPNFENYLQSTLTPNRYFPTGSGAQIVIISIPNKLYGDYINPKTINISWFQGSGTTNVSIYDDGEGNVYLYDSHPDTTTWVGNIIYYHGIIVFTNNPTLGDGGDPLFFDLFNSTDKIVSFQSSYTVYETQVKCTIEPSEFTTTLNPSLISSSKGQVYDFATGSYFSPYVTTVGLYNENQDLVMVAKLAQPLPTSTATSTNIIVNIDR